MIQPVYSNCVLQIMSKCRSGLCEEFIKFQNITSTQFPSWVHNEYIGVCSEALTPKISLPASVGTGKKPAISLDFRVSCLGLSLCFFTLSICLQWGQANMLAFAILFFISFFSCREISPFLCVMADSGMMFWCSVGTNAFASIDVSCHI